jgi:DNA invertase Pin-like site-specific DNA recombinase
MNQGVLRATLAEEPGLVVYYRSGDSHDVREQEQCVESFARNQHAVILKFYQDEESGRRPERPALGKALAYTKRHGAKLLLATLRGLSRDRRFLTRLRDSGVEFQACDLPDANTSTIHILTALADYEAQHASARAKRALERYKERGGKLGSTRPGGRPLSATARRKGAEAAGRASRARADEAYQDITPVVHALRDSGQTLQQIAQSLNRTGHRTRRGRPWNAMQVSRVLKRPPNGEDEDLLPGAANLAK